MYLFNSFSEKKEKVDTARPIGLYVCGITPYDTTHLGHASTFIVYDVLVRYLRFLGHKVTYVQNVTDVDDDILIKAKSLGIDWRELVQRESNKHADNMQRLNALQPDIFPKASAHINAIIRIIGVLIKKGLAYEKNGNVYFEVKRDENFGKLSKYGYRAMLTIANDRGNFPLDSNKRDPLDFVLWQKQKPGEPAWNSPWSRGRPGWHIECSAMSLEYLGPTITIHGGGEDLIFPHHEAEITQSEAYTGREFVKIWMHTAMVYCDGKKMSKSLGNMIFVSDLLKKYSANSIRIFLLSHYWRKPWNYEEEELKKAEETVKVFKKASLDNHSEANERLPTALRKTIPEFFKALDNDLNTPKALKVLVNIAKSHNSRKAQFTRTLGQILGLGFR